MEHDEKAKGKEVEHCRKDQAVINLPAWCDYTKETRTVSIDRCIVPVVRALWQARIKTLGCCCGHGEYEPNVIIGDECKDEDLFKIQNIIRDHDNRVWHILQWQLTKVLVISK